MTALLILTFFVFRDIFFFSAGQEVRRGGWSMHDIVRHLDICGIKTSKIYLCSPELDHDEISSSHSVHI